MRVHRDVTERQPVVKCSLASLLYLLGLLLSSLCINWHNIATGIAAMTHSIVPPWCLFLAFSSLLLLLVEWCMVLCVCTDMIKKDP